MPTTSKRRLVLIFPGFEPLTAESNARRFLRGLNQSAPLYGLSVQASQPSTLNIGSNIQAAGFDVVTTNSAATESSVIMYGLDSIIAAYGAQSLPRRLASGCSALWDFLATGTFRRYARTSWRYALFFLFPILVCCVVAASGVLVFRLLAPWDAAGAFAGAVTLCVAMLMVANHQFHLLLLLDDWSFARDLALGRGERLQEFLAVLSEDARGRITAFDGDEVLLAGHSLGVVPLIHTLAEALRLREKENNATPIGLMTVGSSLLKIALHPAAKPIRADVAEVARSACPWLEVQSVSDPISFYQSNPVADLGLGEAARVRVIRISLRKQLGPRSVHATRFNFFKLHRQFVRAVERRSPYSFHVIACGPMTLSCLSDGRGRGLESLRQQDVEVQTHGLG